MGTKKPLLGNKSVTEKLEEINQEETMSGVESKETSGILETPPFVEKKVLARMKAMREYNLVPELIPIKSGLEYDDLVNLKMVLAKINRNIDRRKEKKITQEALIARYVVECIKRDLKELK